LGGKITTVPLKLVYLIVGQGGISYNFLFAATNTYREQFAMCIICLEFQRSRDLKDARQMLAAARREPTDISREHLDEVEQKLKDAEAATKSGSNP